EKPLNVLLLGGGDFIPMRFLGAHANVAAVDHVDIDPEFLEFAKRDDFLRRLHQGAHDDPRLNTIIADAMSYIRRSTKRYDLILLDLPGLVQDKLLPLYSVEFYLLLQKRLAPEGLIVSWIYREKNQPQHVQIVLQTAREAGLTHAARYSSFGSDGGFSYAQDRFVVFSPGHTPALRSERTPYTQRWSRAYDAVRWSETRRNDAFRVNSVFRPNPRLVVRQ
ncbi:MAG: spermidine synthase, partial [Myxococcota bacterium]